MKNWSKLFKSYKDSNVYRVKQGIQLNEVKQIALSQGLAFFEVDLSKVTSKEDFLSTISKALNFPSYFGMNWDAFEECLTDFEWCVANGYVIVLRGIETFPQSVPKELKIAINIFKSAAKYWKTQKKLFFVIILDQ